MEVGEQSGIPAHSAGSAAEAPRAAMRLFRKHRPLRARDVQLYRACEDLTEPLIYLMVVFSPWAFGTTQPWSIWLMNAAGYLLGLLLAAKLAIRWLKGYRPPRWDDKETTGLRDHETTRPQDHRTTGPRDHGTARPQDHATSPWSVVSSPWSVVRGLWSVVCGQWSRSPRSGRLIAFLAGLTVAILGLLPHQRRERAGHLSSRRTELRLPSLHPVAAPQPGQRPNLAGVLDLPRAGLFLLGHPGLAARQVGRRGTGRTPPASARRRQFRPIASRPPAPPLMGIGCERRAPRGGRHCPAAGRLRQAALSRQAARQPGRRHPVRPLRLPRQRLAILQPALARVPGVLVDAQPVARPLDAARITCSCSSAAIMAACPIISTSRGGALVTVGIIALAAFFLAATHFLLAAHRQRDRRTRTNHPGVPGPVFQRRAGARLCAGLEDAQTPHGPYQRRLRSPPANV